MSFIVELVGSVIDPLGNLIKPILRIIDDFILKLLGIEDQEVEYYDVVNIALFPDPDDKNPTIQALLQSILKDEDITGNLLYASTQRSVKTNFREFINFIDNGEYFEDFPIVESHISYVDYTEVTDVLDSIHGAPCTIVSAKLDGVGSTDWIKYWLQENANYDIGNNVFTGGRAQVTEPVPSAIATGFSYTHVGSLITVNLDDTVQLYDDMIASSEWEVDFVNVEYDEGTDTYIVPLVNDDGMGTNHTPNIPSKPTQLHYIVRYFLDSTPAEEFLFVYKIGTGTYPTLDAPRSGNLEEDADAIKAIPAIPLRVSNTDYTGFSADKSEKIEEACKILDLDAAEILDSIVSDVNAKPEELDNIYVNFGVRLWDTSQAGTSYLFNMFENLYATQGVTQGIYDAANAGDLPPSNNIVITTEDYSYTFRFAYITYTRVTLAEINADTGSVANGVYYSDMSRFNDEGKLVYPYYSSSGKGTYNVGYKADTQEEVELFLAGNGIVNPGDTADGAADWLQVTSKLTYTEPFLESDGSTSDKSYLHPADVYKNNGGTLQVVNDGSAVSTTVKGMVVGQSITYYYMTESGLDAYTVVAPTGAFRVIDGGSGRSQVIRFNLGARDDLMVPMLYNQITELSNADVSRLYLTGIHVSLFIAHYEYIAVSDRVKLMVLVIIAIIVVITIFTWGSGTGPALASLQAFLATASTAAIIKAALVYVIKAVVVQQIIKMILVKVAESNPELAMALAAVFAVAAAVYGSYGANTLDMFEIVGIASNLASNIGMIIEIDARSDLEKLAEEMAGIPSDNGLEEEYKDIWGQADPSTFALLDSAESTAPMGIIPAEAFFALKDAYYDIPYQEHDQTEMLEVMVSAPELFA